MTQVHYQVGFVSLVFALGAAATPSPKPSPPSPPPPCPPSCAYDAAKKGCGVHTTLPDGSSGFVCPKALLFSVGFDSDMVLQRAPAKAAVYGTMVAATPGADASVAVTVTAASGSSYTVQARIAPMALTYCLPGGTCCAANYSATWKAYLKPAPSGGAYTITAVCTGCNVGSGKPPICRTSLSFSERGMKASWCYPRHARCSRIESRMGGGRSHSLPTVGCWVAKHVSEASIKKVDPPFRL